MRRVEVVVSMTLYGSFPYSMDEETAQNRLALEAEMRINHRGDIRAHVDRTAPVAVDETLKKS